VIDEVFQASELVEPHRVAPSIDLEENSNFVFSTIVLLMLTQRSWMSFCAVQNVDEEDDNHIEEPDGADDNNSIEDEDENSD